MRTKRNNKLYSSQTIRKKVVASYRIERNRLKRFKEVCDMNNTSYCKITEVLVDKFLKGEIIILQKDFDI